MCLRGGWGPLAKRDEGDFRGPRRRTGTLLRLPSLPYQQGGESTRRNGCQEPRLAQPSFLSFSPSELTANPEKKLTHDAAMA